MAERTVQDSFASDEERRKKAKEQAKTQNQWHMVDSSQAGDEGEPEQRVTSTDRHRQKQGDKGGE